MLTHDPSPTSLTTPVENVAALRRFYVPADAETPRDDGIHHDQCTNGRFEAQGFHHFLQRWMPYGGLAAWCVFNPIMVPNNGPQ